MSDTGAATHICDPGFFPEFGTFNRCDLPSVIGVGEVQVETYGWRTIPLSFKTTSGETITLSLTFLVCDCSEPLISFTELKTFGSKAILDEDARLCLRSGDSLSVV